MVKRDHEGHILLGAVDVPETTQSDQVVMAMLQGALTQSSAPDEQQRLAWAEADKAADVDAEQTMKDEIDHG